MGNRSRLIGSIVPLLMGALAPNALRAQWIEGVSIPVCTAPGQQTQPDAVPDGFGGVVAAWLDCRNGCSSIYAQRLDALGYPRWGANGMLATSQSPNKGNLVIVGDGAGGAIIAWVDGAQDIYAQKIDASGNLVGPLTGIPICTAKNNQNQLCMVPDGSGGAILAWTDWRRWDPAYPMFEYTDVFVQRINHDGNISWDINGRELVWGDRMASPRSLIYVGRGGAILSYDNCQITGYCDSYLTRISSGGNSLWTLPLTGDQLISNGAGGVIGTWISADSTRGQWIDSAGVAQWGAGGKTILPGMKRSDGVSDGRGGAIFIGSGLAQRVDSNGNRVWFPGGVNIGVDGPLISDGFSGAIVGTTAVQRVDSTGSVLWGPGGAPTSAGANTHLVPDKAGGVILVYGNQDIRAQRINPADHGPVLAAIGARSVNVGDTLRVQLSATDADVSDVLTFSTNVAESIRSPYSFDPQNGLFSWAPRRGDAGDYVVTFAVNDGIFTDAENVTINVFDTGDRPPVLQPIQDITVSAGSPVVVEAIASDPDTDTVTYTVADPRFIQNGNVFRWQTAPSDMGKYYFSVIASDGYLSDTTTVKVTVLAARFYFYGHDAMNGEPGSWFDWGTNAAVWSSDLDGYLSGSTALDSWSSAAVSRRGYDASSNPTVNFRIEYDQHGSQYILGFTPTGADGTNFSSSNVTLGLRVHVGFLKPSWDLNTSWGRPIPSGVIDIRMTILKNAGKIRFQVQHVAGFDSPLSAFNDPDWSVEVARPIGDLYYVQAGPVNSYGRIYDVWGAPEGPAPVLHVASELSVREDAPAVIEASADYAGDWPLAYWITDARYVQVDSIFTWQPHVGEAGVYRSVVYVTDGYKSDSAGVDVTVLWKFDSPGWTTDGAPVCLATDVQEGAQIVSDGYGGTIISWIDRRYGNADIFAQRLDANGTPLWAPNGVPISTSAAQQSNIQMVADGVHGAYIVWLNGAKDIFAQRIDGDGDALWKANGITVKSTGFDALTAPQIALGSDGDLFVAYSEWVIETGAIWYQAGLTAVSSSGGLRWSTIWERVLEGLRSVRIAADPFGGAIVCYANLMEHFDVAHRVGGNGGAIWSRTFLEGTPYIASDGAGGAVVCVGTLGSNKDIRAQRLTPEGQTAWPSSGIPICTASGNQSAIGIASSGADRFTLVWLDARSGVNDIYAQSIDTSGTIFWQADGIQINPTAGVDGTPSMASDEAGGAFIAWSDGSLYAQHIGSNGAPMWDDATGTLRSAVYATGSLSLARAEECGVVAAWNDDRNGGMDIFANSISMSPCNHPPVLSPIGDKRADVGVQLSIQLAAADSDPDDTLTYGTNAAAVLPSAFSFDPGTGLFSWTSVSGETGDYAVRFSVTDGVYIDTETIVITVYEHGTRPPVIEPIDDVTVLASMPVVIEAHASDPDGDELAYSISDARFTRSDSVFSWQTTSADIGTYHFIVSVTDGHLSDSTTVTVSVLEAPPYHAYHDPMTGLPGSPFEWSENAVVWHAEEGAYLSGTTPADWSQAVVSARALNAWADSQVVFRLQFIQGATNYIVGFSQTPPSSTDFDRTRVNLGLYLHSSGTLRPSWSVNTSPWAFTVPSGIVDVRVTLRKVSQTVSFDVESVSSYDDPRSTFSAPDWSAEVSRPVGDTYYVQINPYSTSAKVYDVWLEPPGCGPVLEPIDDVIVWEDSGAFPPVVIEAHATCICGCVPRYWMNDPRFMQCGDGIFCWIVEEGDAGEYRPVVYVTDGIAVDSVTVNVTVLRHPRFLRGYFSFMANATDGPFAWHEREVVWYPEENGYLSGMAPDSWYSSVVSGTSFATAPQRSVIVRFLRSNVTNLKIGFTFTPPRATDFDSRKIDCGVYIDSTGSIRPTGQADNPDVWKTGLHEGVYDLRIDIDKSTSTVKRSLVRVPRFDDPLPDFSTVVWSVQETASIADSCWIQINPYNSVAKIYDVWSLPLIWVDVLSSSAAVDKDVVLVTWTLSERSSDVQFFVSREENNSGVFDELPGISIEKDSLTYTFADNTCKPNTAYRYMVEANYPTGRELLFYQSIKTPPLAFGLLQNHPNPFTSLTTIGYNVPGENRVTLDVYNVLGQHVVRLVDARQGGGRYAIPWDGKDDRGRQVSSGIYFYRIEWGGQTLSRKMILLR